MQVSRNQRKSSLRRVMPGWIVTFADMAVLLLTFFVVLLSFTEMDLQKYRMMAESMAGAFHGQRVVVVTDPASGPEEASPSGGVTGLRSGASVTELATRLIDVLGPEMAVDRVMVSYDGNQVIIRFAEEATFRSGDAAIKPDMIPIIERVVNVLANCGGDVLVTGHTDDRPIVSDRFRSNWDLSAARAVSVVHALVLDRRVAADRVIAAGRAETNPLVPNTSAENRARNRRVEISVREPACAAAD